MGKGQAIGKVLVEIGVAVIAGIFLSFWASYYAKNFDGQNAKPDSGIKQVFYNYGTFINGLNGDSNNAATAIANKTTSTQDRSDIKTAPIPAKEPNRQQPMLYAADDFEISAFKVAQSEGRAILTFAIWNKSNATLYINSNSARGFSVSSDGGIASSASLQNLSSNYGTSDKPNDYTPVSHGSTIYVSVSFPSDKTKGKVGNFNFNLVQLKNGKPIEHTFSEQVPLPQ